MLRSLLCLFLISTSIFADAPDAIITLSPAPPPEQVTPPTPAPAPADNVLGLRSYNWYSLNPKLAYKGKVTWKLEPVIDTIDGKRVIQPGDAGLTKFFTPAKVFGPTRLSVDPVFSDVPAGAAVVWGKAVGKVRLVAWGVDVEDEIEIIGSRILEVVDSSVPVPPGPGPGPGPTPEPKPKASKFYIVIIRDTMQSTVDQSLIFADTAFWDSFKKAGHEWDIYTNVSAVNGKATPQAERKYLELVSGVPLPAILVLDKDSGKRLDVRAMPPTKDEITKLLQGLQK